MAGDDEVWRDGGGGFFIIKNKKRFLLLLLVLIQGQGEGKEGFVFLCLADKRDPLLGLCLCSCLLCFGFVFCVLGLCS